MLTIYGIYLLQKQIYYTLLANSFQVTLKYFTSVDKSVNEFFKSVLNLPGTL